MPGETVGVVGLGIVGGTVAGAFAEAGVRVIGYDRYLHIGSPDQLAESSVVFLCVPTPPGPDGAHDLTEVHAASETLTELLRAGAIVAIKSTIPPGTCDRLALLHPSLLFASVPEFLVASRSVDSFTRPDRVVIGAPNPEAAERLSSLMRSVTAGAPVVTTTPIAAELIKLCSNAMLAAKVSMANELA